MIRHPNPVTPKASSRAALVLAGAAVPPRFDPAARRHLANQLSGRAPGRVHGPQRFDSWRCTTPDTNSGAASPFVWRPHIARRTLGLAAARRVHVGLAPSPLAAVRSEIAHRLDQAASRGTGRGSLASWLTTLPRGARGAVLVEAATYATEVLDALDWTMLGDAATVGGADPVWAVPGAPWISLRARRDGEVTLDPATGTRALVCLRSGALRPDASDDLRVVALADALTQPDAPIPTRVLGVWPMVGRSMSLEVDAADLHRASQLLLEAVDVARQALAAPVVPVVEGSSLRVA